MRLSFGRLLASGWLLFILTFLYVPILVLAAFSFNNSRLTVRWEGFTFAWYQALLENTVLLRALQNSLVVAACATVLSLGLGTVGAWVLHRYQVPFRGAIGFLVLIPMIIPEVLMGASLLILFVNYFGWDRGLGTLVIAHTTFCFPFVLVAVQARLSGLDPSLEEAAMDLGASRTGAFLHVIVPYLLPAIFSGALMAFTLSFDEYIVTAFVNGAESQTLPQKIYGMARIGLNPQLNALSAIFIILSIVAALAGGKLLIRK